jgi:hypothetical protein
LIINSFYSDQLKELRKTTLAHVICKTSDNITEIQVQVMRSIGFNNPIVSCEEIPSVSLDSWKTEMPLATKTKSDIPIKYWFTLKNEVNKKISNISSTILTKMLYLRDAVTDCLSFGNYINMTFIDFKNKFAAFHQKMHI